MLPLMADLKCLKTGISFKKVPLFFRLRHGYAVTSKNG